MRGKPVSHIRIASIAVSMCIIFAAVGAAVLYFTPGLPLTEADANDSSSIPVARETQRQAVPVPEPHVPGEGGCVETISLGPNDVFAELFDEYVACVEPHLVNVEMRKPLVARLLNDMSGKVPDLDWDNIPNGVSVTVIRATWTVDVSRSGLPQLEGGQL